MSERVCILDPGRDRLREMFAGWGEPGYRADQLWDWIYRKGAGGFDEMANLPLSLRRRLEAETVFDPLILVAEQESGDGLTRKALFALPDGEQIETVLMLYDDRRSVCLSTQVGCAVGCPFCATGQMGFVRNLSVGEMAAQALYFSRLSRPSGGAITNVVFMGMGEPMNNYGATWETVRRLNDPDGFGLGARHMTISTVGIVPGIRRMAKEPQQVNLAVSLHAPDDALRDRLVPVNRRYPLAELLDACREYVKKTNRRVTFEYALIDGVNDSEGQAGLLAGLLGGMLCHVNLIPLNPTGAGAYRPSPRERVAAFRERLERGSVNATVRLGRGVDIKAGCGQLRRRFKSV